MSVSDWKLFKKSIWSWNLAKAGPEKSALGTVFCPDDKFRMLYPIFTELLAKARVTELVGPDGPRLLYGWTAWTEDHLWWLSPPPGYAGNAPVTKLFRPEHRLLLQHFGGILESEFLPGLGTLAINQNYLFAEAKCQQGFDQWNEHLEKSKKEFSVRFDPADYLTFVEEANGNRTAYSISDGKVVMFAHDHYFQYIKPLEGWPDYTLYKFDRVESFCDYVEVLAAQWLNALSPSTETRTLLFSKDIFYVDDPDEVFAHQHPELRNKVKVISIYDAEVLERYKGAMSPAELYSRLNLRGVPKTPDGRGLVRQLRREWRKYFAAHPDASVNDLHSEAARLDATYGRRFKPPVEPR